MSEAITSPVPEQVQPTTPPADTTPATEPQEDAAATVADVPSAKGLASANRTLDKFEGLCQRLADQNYTLGETAAQYVGQLLGASDKSTRSRAVADLADRWLRWDEDSLGLPLDKARQNMAQRVNALLKGNAVRTLLGDGRDEAKGDGTARGRGKGGKGGPIPWGKLRELAPLVDRDPADNVEEWSALSDAVAEQGKALVVEIATSGLARDDVKKAVREIVAAHWTVRVAEMRAVAAADPANKNAQRAVQTAEKTAAVWVDKVLKGTTPEPKPESKPETPDVQGKAGPATEPTPEPKPEPQPRAVNFTAIGKAGTPATVAEACAEMVTANDDCDDVLERLLRMLRSNAEMCPKSKRACSAALAVLSVEDKPTVRVAPLNGELVGAA